VADVTYVKKSADGKTTHEQIASTPADHVRLQFDGWTPKPATKPAAAPAGDTKTGK
jgi:hypothetical protein